MRLAATVVMMAVGASAWAAEADGREVRNVTVCMSGYAGVPTYAVERTVSEILSEVRVRLEWSKANSCPASPDVIKISFADRVPKELSTDAMAYALPFEGAHIVVFHERVRQACGCARQLLAYVVAHEIAHILQGIERHSESGIMKAHWSYMDYDKMQRKSLVFTAYDVLLIHNGLAARAARLAGKGTVQVATR